MAAASLKATSTAVAALPPHVPGLQARSRSGRGGRCRAALRIPHDCSLVGELVVETVVHVGLSQTTVPRACQDVVCGVRDGLESGCRSSDARALSPMHRLHAPVRCPPCALDGLASSVFCAASLPIVPAWIRVSCQLYHTLSACPRPQSVSCSITLASIGFVL